MKKAVLLLTIAIFSCSFSTFGQNLQKTLPINTGVFTAYPVLNNYTYGWEDVPYESYEDVKSGVHFRIKFPPGYVKGGGTKYPVIVFFHGAGEFGTNNYTQLKHGGQRTHDAIENGEFPGIALYAQKNVNDTWNSVFPVLQILDALAKNADVDPDRIYIHGLSAGGKGTWLFLHYYYTCVAAAAPMAQSLLYMVSNSNPIYLSRKECTPIWLAQGGNDKTVGASPADANEIVRVLRNNGSYIRYSYYPTFKHDVWSATYNKPDFFTWFLEHKLNDIHVFFEEEKQCAGEPMNVVLGTKPGQSGYQWRKDNVVISGATTNKITVTQPGTYEVRFTRVAASGGMNWPGIGEQTPWSDPVVITLDRDKTPSVSISNKGKSVNLPSLDGSTAVDLVAPPDYFNYLWYRDGSSVQTGIDSVYNANVAGYYGASVKEAQAVDFFIDTQSDYDGDGVPEPKEVPLEFRPDASRCQSDLSNLISVTTENLPGVPNKPKNVFLTLNTPSSVKVSWDDNSVNELGYEIYRSVNPGGPYTLMELTNPKVDPNPQSYIDNTVEQNITYYYVLRAVNERGGSEYTTEKSISTVLDTEGPSKSVLSVAGYYNNFVDLKWTRATDNFAVLLYNVYVNGVLNASVADTLTRIVGLAPETVYTFYVEAVDVSSNVSEPSNQVTQATISNGVFYSYYEGTWTVLPQFNLLTPIKTGVIGNIDLSPRLINDFFGFKFDAQINIPTTGTYTFYTSSDDGSKLYIDGNPVVDNDKTHSATEVSGSTTLTAGRHNFTVTYFEFNGGESLAVRWEGPGISKQIIPSSAFLSNVVAPIGPNAPDGFSATSSVYNQVNLNWTDNVPNETGYNIFRSANLNGPFGFIGTLPSGSASFNDDQVAGSGNYYYKISAFNGEGSSIQPDHNYRLFMPLNGNIDDISTNGISNSGTPTFSNTDYVEGGSSLDVGSMSSSFINVDVGAVFIRAAFTERSISFWFKTSDINSNQTLFEEGSRDDGIALRINSGSLQLGVQNNNSTPAIISTPITADTWHHVVGVFNYGILSLYLDGQLMNQNTYVGYSSVRSHNNGAGLGYTNSSDAFNNTQTRKFSGKIDAFMVFTNAIDATEVRHLYHFPKSLSSVTTPSAPTSPNAPSALTASGISSTEIELEWNDNSDDETGFEIYRTTSSMDVGWILVNSVPSQTTTYTDGGLDGNSVFYYKVRAKRNEQVSEFSNIANGSTNNASPVFTNVFDRNIRLNSILNILIKADDPDGDALTISATGMPAFGTFVDNLDGTASINFSTGSSCPDGNCSYLITLSVTDGSSTIQDNFTLTISDNNDPVLTPIANQTVDEGRILDVAVTIKDSDNDVKVVVLGSSTAAGVGASVADSAWVNRLDAYLKNISNSAQVVNLAASGFTTRKIRPTANDPTSDPARNIDAAVAQNPDFILVNLPSNNVAQDIDVATTIAHYNEIKAVADANAIPIFFTTTQPRNFDGESLSSLYSYEERRQLLDDEAQAVRDNFGNSVMDIYDELTDFINEKRIKTAYNSGDNIHLNDAGHAYIFSVVKNTLVNYAGINDIDIQVNNQPDFVSVIRKTNGTRLIRFKPGYLDAGTYAEIEVFALDGKGGLASSKFNLAVINTTEASTAYINFSDEAAAPTNPWRKTGAHTTGLLSNIIDDTGLNTGWALDFATDAGLNWTSTQSGDQVTGIYPAEVMRTRFGFTSAQASDFVEMELSGLSTGLKYDLTLFSSRDEVSGATINTNFTIGNETKAINAADNANVTAAFISISPDVDGKVKIRVSQGTSTTSPVAYLNSMVIRGFFDSGLKPTAPSNLNITLNGSNQPVLTWNDNSDNERQFTILRSTSIGGVYESIASVSENVVTYTDASMLLGHFTYYYKVEASNFNGSTQTAVKSIQTQNNNPVLQTNMMYSIKAGVLTNINISGTDQDGDALSFYGENLPSFVKIKNNGDNTATLECIPESFDIGNFTGIKIRVTEPYGGVVEKNVFLNVLSGEFEEQVYINLSPVYTFDEPPFNTIAENPVTGTTYNSLLDVGSNPTSMNLVVGTGWTGASTSGVRTLTNSGIIVDEVLYTNWYTGNTAVLSIGGLDNSKLYNLVFVGSDAIATSATRYSVGGNAVDLITGGNTANAVQLNGISPSSSKIDINIQRINSSANGHLNAILIQSYQPPAIPMPTFLTVIGGRNDRLELRWKDNSGNETGFEILSKELPSGTSTLLTTTAANVTSYIHSGLQANKTYEYRIRAKSSSGYSNYSNTAFGSTYEFQIKINVSGPPDATPQSPDVTNNFPNWNNLYSPPENGQTYNNLINDTGGSTVIDLTMDEIGVGFDRNFGATTGNNSGVYPDAVMQSFYFYEAGDNLGQWTIKSLDPNYAYNITFTGSCVGWLLDNFQAKGITEYIIDDKSLFLDTRDNTSGAVTFYNIFPDQDNNIVINVRAADIPVVNYGLLNAIVIQGYSKVDRAADENFYTYYGRDNTNIALASNWNTRIDGTGTSLNNFNGAGLEYILDQNVSVTAQSDLNIGGSGSIIKVKDNASLSINSGVSSLQIPELVVYNGVNFDINSIATSAPTINVTSGNLTIMDLGVFDIDSLHLVVSGSGGINKNAETGRLALKNASMSMLSSTDEDQHLYFLPGFDSVKNFTVNNGGAGSIILEEKLHARNAVELQDGVLNANGNLVLVSDEKATANLLRIGAGASVVGNVEYQRYWKRPVGTAGFFYIGHPVQNQTVGDWVGEFQINGLGTSAWKNLNIWDETQNKWVPVTSAATPMLPGEGVNAFMFSQNFADEFIRYNNVGQVTQGDFTFDLSYTPGADPGWNLVANPYPCAIDWNLVTWDDPAFVNRVDAAFHVWDQESGSYKTWTRVIPPSLESPIIASGQGFFIRTNQTNTNPILLTVTESIKINSQPAFLRKSNGNNILQIIAENTNSKKDVAYISLFDGATPGFDSQLDGRKLAGSYVNLSSVSETGDDLAVNALPPDRKEYSVPLIIKSTQEGEMSFTFNNVESFNKNYYLVLVDSYNDTRSEIGEGMIYSFTIIKSDTGTWGGNRFRVEINKTSDKTVVNGGVLNRYNQPIGQVLVQAQADFDVEPYIVETDANGLFSMNLIKQNSYTFNPVKSDKYDASIVNFADYVALNWFFRSNSNAYDDLGFIAADIDNSGDIDKTDLKALRKIVAGYNRQTRQTFDYRFISDGYKMLRDGFRYTLSNGLEVLPALDVQNIVNIRGLVPGDIVVGKHQNNIRESLVTDPVVFVLGTPVEYGEAFYKIPVFGRNFTDVAGFMLRTGNLIEQVSGGAIHTSGSFVYSDEPDGTIIWTNEPGKGSTLQDGTLLFYLVLNQEMDVLEMASRTLVSQSHVALNSDLKQVDLKVEDLSQKEAIGNVFLGAYPNPFTDHVAFRLKIEKPESVTFYLYSSNGAIIHKSTVKLDVGVHHLNLAKDLGFHGHISKGLTIFRIQLADAIFTDKLIRN